MDTDVHKTASLCTRSLCHSFSLDFAMRRQSPEWEISRMWDKQLHCSSDKEDRYECQNHRGVEKDWIFLLHTFAAPDLALDYWTRIFLCLDFYSWFKICVTAVGSLSSNRWSLFLAPFDCTGRIVGSSGTVGCTSCSLTDFQFFDESSTVWTFIDAGVFDDSFGPWIRGISLVLLPRHQFSFCCVKNEVQNWFC